MSDEKEIGLMLRLPPDLHEEVKRFAAGNGKRPRSSLNATVIFLLRSGLTAERQKEHKENEPGQHVPQQLNSMTA